jgi:hypothetical protein
MYASPLAKTRSSSATWPWPAASGSGVGERLADDRPMADQLQ